MLAILNSLNAHNCPIFQPILMILVSKFMVHRALSDKTHFLLGLLSPLNISKTMENVNNIADKLAESILSMNLLTLVPISL